MHSPLFIRATRYYHHRSVYFVDCIGYFDPYNANEHNIDRLEVKHHHKGFTLIELMAVIFILGILTTIVAVNVETFLQRAEYEKARTDIAQIEKALETYRFQHYSYPTTDEGIEALIQAPEGIKNKNLYPRDGYLSSVPIDPWGNDYLYLFPGQFSKYDVYSLGADGSPGGDSEDADIGNWDEK